MTKLRKAFSGFRSSFSPPDGVPRKLKNQVMHQALPTAIMALAFFSLYLLSLKTPPGWLTYWLSAVALFVIWLTAVARVNDITARGRRWHIRRFGLVLCGTAAFTILAKPLFPPVDFPSWFEVMLRWGFALTWFTTPNMPPWHKFISGEDERETPRHPEPQL